MEHHIAKSSSESPTATTFDESSAEPPLKPVTHPVLSRLLEEVRNENAAATAYDRVHNRHNRGGR